MASTYKRKDSPYYWISFKTADGKWKAKPTGIRDEREAKRFAKKVTAQEQASHPSTPSSWQWVDGWIELKYGHSQNTTPARYRKWWRKLQLWLAETGLGGPAAIRREHVLGYPEWRKRHGAERNTSLHELGFLRLVLEEALEREMIQGNPARRLRIKRERPEEKRPFTDEELARVDAELEARDKHGWMRVTYLLGRYQAARLRSCALPLSDIDLTHGTIFYSSPKGGRKRAYSQPIDRRLSQPLAEIVEYRRALGKTTLCDLPFLPSVEWKRFLESIRISGVSHHSLRVTWVTAAAIAGIPESAAMRFSNHSSSEVHRIYARFSASDMASMLSKLS